MAHVQIVYLRIYFLWNLPWIQAFSGDYWNRKFSKVLFRSNFLASRIFLKSLEHLSLHLIYEKFPKNLKHKYRPKIFSYIGYQLTVIIFFFTHTFKKLISSVYTRYLSVLAKSIPHPTEDGDLPILNCACVSVSPRNSEI